MSERRDRVLPRTGYPRRRAVTACSICRERKKKCDNGRPSCSFCRRVGADCHYDARDASSFDPASLQILDRLSVIETMIRDLQLNQSPAATSSQPQGIDSASPALNYQSNLDSTLSDPTVWRLNLDANYKVGTDSVLQWPVFEKPLAFLPQFSLLDYRGNKAQTRLEDAFNKASTPNNSVAQSQTTIHISTERRDIQCLVNQFFDRVHVKNPILDRSLVEQYCVQYCEEGPMFNLESCLVLIVCALGSVATEFIAHDPSSQEEDGRLPQAERAETLRRGNAYFSAAEKRLGMAHTSSNIVASQCLCLAGIYHMYTLNPVAALRMAILISQSLKSSALTRNSAESDEGLSQLNSSLFWACFKSEREILSELPIAPPALGELASEGYPRPQGGFTSRSVETWTKADQDSWFFFLSEIALRRITDEVAEVVIDHIGQPRTANSHTAIEDLIPIIVELEQHIQTWRDRLPTDISFGDVPQPVYTEWQQYSRGRYYRALELMYRPFVFSAIHSPDCSETTRQLASKGLANAFNYLQHCHLIHRHHGLWLQLRNELREASLLLAGAGSNLEMPHGWYSGVKKTLESFKYWEVEFRACQSYTAVILALDDYRGTCDERERSLGYPWQ